MAPVPKTHPLRRWFAGLVEQSFQSEVGLCDPCLLDYLASLLTEFIHIERINVLADGSGRLVDDVAEMLSQAESAEGPIRDERRRSLHRHIGDYTLFWTGVYPENLRKMHRRRTRDDLISFLDQGKRSYAIASDLSSPDSQPPALVLRTLSDQFEYCVYGLGLVRREWEHVDAPPGDRLSLFGAQG